MTDTNIIHALQCCGVETNCRNCPLYKERSAKCICTVLRNALDLITRQQAENENLKVENQSLRTAANSLKMHYEKAQSEIDSLKIFRGYAEKRANDYKTMRDKYLNAKSEAVKEFAMKLKSISKFLPLTAISDSFVTVSDIDNTLKEMVGENNG